MPESDRRGVIRAGAAGAIAMLSGFAAPVALAAEPKLVRVPKTPMCLSRTVTRELIDHANLIVQRSWEIDFTQRGSGWVISGEQLAVSVDAPAALEPLAKLERERVADEAFPILIDSYGLIDRSITADSHVDISRVSNAAIEVVKNRGGGAVEKAELRRFLAQLQQAASSLMTHFPQDLFFPLTPSTTESRTMDLPGGMHGEVTMTYESHSEEDNGLLIDSKREISTRIAGDVMHSVESWSLLPM